MARGTEAIEVGRRVRQYTVAEMGAGLSLLTNTDDVESGARKIIMKAAGTLRIVDGEGTEVELTDLPAWYEHSCKTRAISAGLNTAVIVYW